MPPEEGIGIPLNEAPVWQRMLVMVAGAVMNFVLGFVVLLILLTAQSSPLTSKVIYAVEDSALCGQTGLQAGDEIVAVNGRRCAPSSTGLTLPYCGTARPWSCRMCSSTPGRTKLGRCT